MAVFPHKELDPYLIEAKREIELQPLPDKLKSWVKSELYSKDSVTESLR